MNSIAKHPLHYHTWRDIGGPLGLLLDGAFFVFVVISALGVITIASLVLLADKIASPLVSFCSRLPGFGKS